MPSESVCYPAKLSHGHIMNLLDKDIDFIWMPCAKYERQEDETAGNHFQLSDRNELFRGVEAQCRCTERD